MQIGEEMHTFNNDNTIFIRCPDAVYTTEASPSKEVNAPHSNKSDTTLHASG